MSRHGTGAIILSFFLSFLAIATAHAAIDDGGVLAVDLLPAELPTTDWSGEHWQRFLAGSRSRFQALAEKAAWLEQPLEDACIEPQLSLAERYYCLRSDVFARSALELTGMGTAEYVVLLHRTLAINEPGPTAQQRRQFQRLLAEWWPVRYTASQ